MNNVLATWVALLATSQLSYGKSNCDPAMLGRCFCGLTKYEGRDQYVVNCTDSKFNDAKPLQRLPADTEVLIVTGNDIKQLPWNVFGILQTYDKLRVVDMTNNNIHTILGKSYHRVSNVQRLILNHNHISIAEEDRHPRMFSNFVNLEELHLTNAFEDNSADLGIDLHDVFVNSNLTRLIKLHLEQNEIRKFKDDKVFCDLPQLMDLHLGDNHLTQIDFNIDCLPNLRFIDLEGNNITKLRNCEMAALDRLPAKNQSLTIDLTDNPFSCECGIHQLFDWVQKTKVAVRDSYNLRCHREDGETPPKNPALFICDEEEPQLGSSVAARETHAAAIALSFLTIILLSLLAFFIYNNRKSIQIRMRPMVETVSRKVYYSSIEPNDDQEINV